MLGSEDEEFAAPDDGSGVADSTADVPRHLAARDAAWAPSADERDGALAVPADLGDDDARRALAAADSGESPLLVVPDDAEPYAVVRGDGGGWVRTVRGLAPGAALADALGLLDPDGPAVGSVDSGALARLRTADDFELGEVAGACQRLMSWARGLQAAAVTELSHRPAVTPEAPEQAGSPASPRAATALELVEPLHVTAGQAEALVAESSRLTEDFAATHAALLAGKIDERRAKVVLSELGRLDPDTARTVEAAALDRAARMNPRQLRRAVKALVCRLAPEAAETRRRRAAERRHIHLTPAEDGMTWLDGLLPAEDALALQTVLDAGQKSLKSQDAAGGDARARTADQRRADTLAGLAWTALNTGRAGAVRMSSTHGRPVTVDVTVPLATLIGLDEHPGHLEGYGPVPADVARHLSASGVWRWVGTHPVTGAVLSHGRTRYTPTQDLIDHVVLRDRTCKAPGCDAPAQVSELDHTLRYPLGPTAAHNLGLTCTRHHRHKHRSNCRVDQPSPGVFRWRSPTGRTIRIHETQVGPVDDVPPF
ncbi:uncharacterized protein DUF222 [Haloactinopolyspora alba]|uniref:Uncharacterized protein DUF222 n=1 Tax=Haloactinopolyspora alba TaxID=648780 RepID=A0A2P8DN82_9ACTN|nr:HNH endonuclease signature motif containing protein [Haloactinopolyspora alba]PSK98686.1 uncharacterized protein DUF222 [Haloactinopolyspora alba]